MERRRDGGWRDEAMEGREGELDGGRDGAMEG